jgi:hypothetical protein
MADYTSDSQTWTRYRWIVPTPTNIAEIGKAFSAAERAAKELEVGTSFDDWLTIEPTDEAIVMWFDIKTVTT